jgi:hypothetical protein
MIETLSIVLACNLAVGLAAAVPLLRVRRAMLGRVEAAEQGRARLESEVTAFQGAVEALAQALGRAEERYAQLVERVDAFECSPDGGQPYGDAIRLVRQGAAETRLIDELGLSPVEARLIVRLHGERAH